MSDFLSYKIFFFYLQSTARYTWWRKIELPKADSNTTACLEAYKYSSLNAEPLCFELTFCSVWKGKNYTFLVVIRFLSDIVSLTYYNLLRTN